MSAPAPAPAPAPPSPARTAAQHWEALYAQVEHLSPGAAERLFERARAGRGSWTLDEFKGWFNHNYPSFANAGKFFVLYIFYALYLAYEAGEDPSGPWYNQRGAGPTAGGPMRFYAPATPGASVVDAVFASAGEAHEQEQAQEPCDAMMHA